MAECAKRRTRSLMHVVEAGYGPAASVPEWLGVVTKAVHDTVGRRALAVVGRALHQGKGKPLCPYVIHTDSPAVLAAMRAQEACDTGRVDVVAGGPGLRRMKRDAQGRDEHFDEMVERFLPFGVAEMSHVTVTDGLVVCSVGVLHTTPTLGGAPRVWGQVEVHLRAALRLQQRGLDLLRSLPDDAAILDARGAVVHATGAARGASHRAKLRSAVRNIDKTRGAREVDEARALDVWQGLIDGRWSIVDRHDSDGRRFIVAVPNELGVPDRTSLTRQEVQVAALACEGYSDKWIGYTLGLARSTVATHLASAMAKLGVSSRVGLSTTFQPWHDASHGLDRGPGAAS